MFLLVGRGGGKSFIIKELLLKAIIEAPYMSEVYYVGPTNMQAKEIIWDVLIETIKDLGWYHRPLISKSRIEFAGRKKLYVIGAEKIDRIRGHHNVALIALDEYAYFKHDYRTIFKAIKDTLKKLKGRVIISTTPNGIGTEAHKLYLNIENQHNWAIHHWTSRENCFVEEDEGLMTLDEKGILEENEAIWVAPSDTAYYNFNPNIHVTTELEINYSWPVKICLDFNVNPTTLLVTQLDQEKNINYCIDEYSIANSSTEETVLQFCNDYKNKSGVMDLRVRGDAAGRARNSATGFSDYYYLEELLKQNNFNYKMEVRRSNPPIIDRVKFVNGWLKPYLRQPKIMINKRCKELILDLQGQELKGRVPTDKNNRGHKADAFGYDIYLEELNSRQSGSETIIL